MQHGYGYKLFCVAGKGVASVTSFLFLNLVSLL